MTAVSLINAIARCFRDRRGASAALVALALPAMLGLGGLGVETGLWYTVKRQNQSAADAAAISAAYELIAYQAQSPPVTCPAANLTPAATEAAAQNGYSGATPVVTCPFNDTIVVPPAVGVAVDLQSTGGTLLASLFLPSITIATRGVARIAVLDSPCVLALNPTAANAIDLQGSVTVNAPDCSAVADSNNASAIHIQGSASITTGTLVTPGNISYTGSAFTLNSTPLVGSAASAVPDPFKTTPSHATLISGMPPVPPVTNCASPNPPPQGGVTTSYPANSRFCGGLVVKGGTTNLAPGIYWITDGSLDIQSNGHVTCTACTGGAGVTIILTAGSATGQIGTVSMNSNSSMILTAPSTGTFAGMLIMQDKASNIGAGVTYTSSPSNQASFQGGTSGSIGGLIYLPHETVTMQGNPNSTCALIISDKVVMQGNPTFTLAGCPNSLTSLITVKDVVLAE